MNELERQNIVFQTKIAEIENELSWIKKLMGILVASNLAQLGVIISPW